MGFGRGHHLVTGLVGDLPGEKDHSGRSGYLGAHPGLEAIKETELVAELLDLIPIVRLEPIHAANHRDFQDRPRY